MVIANPQQPHSGSIKEFKDNLKKEFRHFCGTADLYTCSINEALVFKIWCTSASSLQIKFMRKLAEPPDAPYLGGYRTPVVIILETCRYLRPPPIRQYWWRKSAPRRRMKALAATFTEESQQVRKTFLEKGFAISSEGPQGGRIGPQNRKFWLSWKSYAKQERH